MSTADKQADVSTNEAATTTTSQVDMTIVSLVITLVALLVAVAGVGYYIWYGMEHTPATVQELPNENEAEEVTTERPEYTTEEKYAILADLQSNTDATTTDAYATGDKRTILESLATDSAATATAEDAAEYTTEEKYMILESLQDSSNDSNVLRNDDEE